MSDISRNTSHGSAGSLHGSHAGSIESQKHGKSGCLESKSLNERPVGSKSRTPSYSLLSTSPSSSLFTNRKSRVATADTSINSVERASISMPPPSKPSSRRSFSGCSPLGNDTTANSDLLKPSRSMDNGSAFVGAASSAKDETDENTPNMSGTQGQAVANLNLPKSIMRSAESPSGEGDLSSNRLSFSSLMSIGSAIYGQSRSANSVASSNDDSLRGGPLERIPSNNIPTSPTRAAIRSDGNVPTTATDFVNVNADQTGVLRRLVGMGEM